MASPTVVLITGTTRGVGKAILELYLLKPDHIIISGNRDPNNTASQALVDPANAIRDLESHGVDHVDIVITNAKIALLWISVAEDTSIPMSMVLFTTIRPFGRSSSAPRACMGYYWVLCCMADGLSPFKK